MAGSRDVPSQAETNGSRLKVVGAAYGGRHRGFAAGCIGVALSITLAGCFSARFTTLSGFASADGHFDVTVPGRWSRAARREAVHSLGNDPQLPVRRAGGPRFVVIYGDADPRFIANMSSDAALDQFEASNVSAAEGLRTSNAA